MKKVLACHVARHVLVWNSFRYIESFQPHISSVISVWNSRTMNVLFSSRLCELRRCLIRMNPLATVLGDNLDTLLESGGDLLNASEEQKQITKKQYLIWCRKNHPDKNENVDEDALYVYKHFGPAFLRYSEAENDFSYNPGNCRGWLF